MLADGQGPRRTTSLEEVVISTSPLADEGAAELSRRQAQFSAEPLLTSEPSPQHQQQGHWFRHRARASRTGSEYDPDDQAEPALQQSTGTEQEGLSPSAIEKLSKLKVFQHLRERHTVQQRQAADDATITRQGPGPPQKRPSNIHVAAHTMAGDLHTSEHTKKDAKEHHLLKSFRRRKKRSSRGSKSDKGSQEGMSDIVRMEELEEAERKAAKPRWKRRQFWHTAIPLFVSAVLLIVGTVLALKHYQTQDFHGNFDAWRWLLMVGVLVPIHHTGNLAVRCMVWAVESIFFFQKKALYYLVGTKKYLSRMIKGALVCGLFAAIFRGQSNINPTVHEIYEYIIKILVCIFLWLVVDVLKTMGAKLMANHFHQETYFQRMHEALRKEYFLMALSQPRQDNRASKHMRVASVTAGMMTRTAASVTAGMEPRNIEALRRAHEKERGDEEAKKDSKPAPKGIMRNLKSGASGIASVAPRMVKFRSNIQYLGEKVAEITPKPLKRMLSSRPSSRKPTTEDREGSETEVHRNPLSSSSAEAPRQRPQARGTDQAESMRRAQTAPFPLSDADVQIPATSAPARSQTIATSQASTQGRGVDVNAEDMAIHHRRAGDGYQETTDPQPPVSRRTTASTQGDLGSRLQSPASSKRVSHSSSRRSLPSRKNSLRRGDSRIDHPAGYSMEDKDRDQDQPKLSGWAKLRMARRLQNNVKEVQAENLERRNEEVHLAELTATARNDEEVIAKLHKVEKHIRKNNLTVTFTDQLGQAKHSEHVTGEKEARKLAFYLFWNIKPYFTRNHIIMEDLEAFLSPEQAVEAFAMLDNNGDGKLVLADIRDAVIKIYKERRNLALSLKDTKTVVGKLELVIGVVLHIIFIFFYLMVFNVNVTKVWLTLSSIIVALSFAFSNTIMNLFNSVIMLFVVHPFDVGDALLIATNTTASGAAEYVVVEELSLQSTVMRRWDGTRIWYPNVKLNAMPLLNMSRSDSKVEIFKVQVDISTPSAVTATLRRNLMEFFDENSKEFVPGGGTVIYLDSQDPLKMTLGIVFTYAHNGVNLGRTGEARHKIFVFISGQLSELGVHYTLPSFKAASTHGLPDGMAFARPNAILPGRSNFRRSQGFDTNDTGDVGGGVE